MKLEIVEAQPHHCGQIVRRLRAEHKAEVNRTGTDAHRELRAIFEKSAFRRSLFIDGQLAAVGGVAGTLASGHGYVWLALSEVALGHPVALAREGMRQMRAIMRTHTELATTVLAGDAAGIRFATFLGFHTSKTEPIVNRKRALEMLACDSACRISIGGASAIALGYHQDRAA